MALTTEQQFQEGIEKSNYVLVAFRKNFHADSLASSAALGMLLKKMGKTFDIVCDNIHIPENLTFLPGIQEVGPKMEELQKLIITLDLKDNEVDQFSYDIQDKHLNIYVTPKFSSFQKDHIATQFAPYKYDLIITIDTPDLESLGKIYDEHTDFFFHTPIINIDHHPSNENFGQVNIIDLKATSVAEVLLRLLVDFKKELLDKDIATCLLAGIIAKTKSFTTQTVTPQTLKCAQELIDMDADRNMIIKNLYRNKTLPTINLWGRVLARLKHDTELTLSWSLISENDFIESSTTERNLEGIVDEFIKDIANVEIIVILYQKGLHVHGIIHSIHNQEDVLALVSEHKPQGTKYLAGFTLFNTHISEAEKKVIDKMREKLKRKKRG